jgi:hypothetical protein
LSGVCLQVFKEISESIERQSPTPSDFTHNYLDNDLNLSHEVQRPDDLQGMVHPPFEDFLEVTEITIDDVPLEVHSNNMPPPLYPYPNLLRDLSEPVKHKQTLIPMGEFEFALGIWCLDANLSRRQYSGLLEVLGMLKDVSTVKRLPRNIQTLKNNAIARVPLMEQRRQEVSLNEEKLPTLPASLKSLGIPKTPKGWVYWFDPISLITAILSAKDIVKDLHFGMAHFVDQPSELWHSVSWASSIRSTSGQYAYYADGSPLFPSDIISYRCLDADCRIKHLGRVRCVGKDYRSTAAVPGIITLELQKLLNVFEVELLLPHVVAGLEILLCEDELILREDEIVWITEKDVVQITNEVIVDYTFDWLIKHGKKGDIKTQGRPPRPNHFHLRRTANCYLGMILPLVKSDPIRAELELETYGRTHFLEPEASARSASKDLVETVSLPLLCFIDAFGLYRNIYRSIIWQ